MIDLLKYLQRPAEFLLRSITANYLSIGKMKNFDRHHFESHQQTVLGYLDRSGIEGGDIPETVSSLGVWSEN